MERNQCIGLVVLVGIILAILVWKYFSRESVRMSKVEEPSIPSTPPDRNNLYLDLRMQALEMPPEMFEVVPDSRRPVVYGVLMDWELGGGTATFVSFISGDTSSYTSSGGGVIGGVGHENVRNASVALIEKAKDYIGQFVRSDDASPPRNKSVKFFLLTTQGRFVAEEEMVDFDNGSSPLLGLFVEANKVITELRKITPDR